MEKFDKIISDKIFDMEVTPPAGLWHQISDNLNSSEQAAATVKEKGKSISLVWVIRIAAVFLGIVAIGINLTNKETNTVANNNSKKVLTVPANAVQKNAVPVINDIKTQVAIKEEKTVVTAASKTNEKISQPEIRENLAAVPQPDIKVVSEEQTTLTAKSFIKNETSTAVNVGEENIPVYSLKLLNSSVPSNDEITVISNETKETPKKVIIIEKKLNKKPSLDVQIPYRF